VHRRGVGRGIYGTIELRVEVSGEAVHRCSWAVGRTVKLQALVPRVVDHLRPVVPPHIRRKGGAPEQQARVWDANRELRGAPVGMREGKDVLRVCQVVNVVQFNDVGRFKMLEIVVGLHFVVQLVTHDRSLLDNRNMFEREQQQQQRRGEEERATASSFESRQNCHIRRSRGQKIHR